MYQLSKNTTSKFPSFKDLFGAFIVFFARFVNFMPNFSPVGAFGFFGKNPIPYFLVIVVFDIIYKGFYTGFLYTYLGFFLYFVLGRYAKEDTKKQVLLLPLASILFFLVSNLGVYLNWYPKGFDNLLLCYVSALPFFKMTILSDLFFGYGYLIVLKFIRVAQDNTNLPTLLRTKLIQSND